MKILDALWQHITLWTRKTAFSVATGLLAFWWHHPFWSATILGVIGMLISAFLRHNPFWRGAILGIIGMLIWWRLHSLYKKVGRRCSCGLFRTRKNKIRLAPDETKSIYSTQEAKRPPWLPSKLWW